MPANLNDLPIFSPEMVKTYLYVGTTLLFAVLIDNILRALIKVPKHFDNRRARTAAAVTRNLISIIVFTIAIYIMLTILGVNLTPFLASASVIGIILGIGARSIIEDFVTGLFFLSLDSIAIGDYVKIGEAIGYVEKIGSRTLTLRADDGSLHIIPNSQVKGLANFSRSKASIIIDFPVKVNQDVNKALKSLETALTQLKEDEKLGDAVLTGSMINGIEEFKQPEMMIMRVTLVTHPIRRWELGRQYRYLVKREFEKHKLVFA